MKTQNKNDERIKKVIIQVIGFCFFCFLFYISLEYYKERMLSFDSSYYSFLMLQQKTYNFFHGRWISYFSEVIPFMALRQNCSMEFFLKLYSVSFICIYYFLFLVCTLLFKNQRAGIVLMLSLCLAFRLIFYYAVTELFMGIALTAVLWALIAPESPYVSKRDKWIATFLSMLLIYTISYCHQLTFFMVMFIILLEMISSKRFEDRQLIIVFVFTFVWYFLRIKVLSISDYEKEKLDVIANSLNFFPDFFSLPSWMYLKTFFVSSLKPLCITFLFCFGILAYRRKWLLLFFAIIFLAAYTVFTVMIFPEGSNKLFYEYYYTTFGLMAAVLLMRLIYRRFPLWITLLLTILLITINLNGIYKAHFIMTERVKYLDRLTNYGRHLPNKKYLINVANIPLDIVAVQGFLPFETLLYSSLHAPDSAVTFFWREDMHEYDSLLNINKIFLGPDFAPTRFRTDLLNKEFYRLPAGSYRKVNTSQADTVFHESLFDEKNVRLSSAAASVHSNSLNFIIAPIKILNTSGNTIFSTPDAKNPVRMSYHLYAEDGKLISFDNARTTLEVDIVDEYTQGLQVYLPRDKGTYLVEADLVTENVRWWNTKTRFRLVAE